MKPKQFFLFATISVLLYAPLLIAQEKAKKIGNVHFPVSCNAEAQKEFDRAVALLHSFWFPESNKAFAAVAQIDPNCAMAYWGIAKGQRLNPISNVPNVEALKKGWAAVEKAKSIGAKTQRERDYIAAIEALYKDSDKLDHATRSLTYEKAMEQVYLRYPEDREAAIFYALSLLPNETTVTVDKSYTKQLKAGQILEKVFAEQPDHPGVAHYIIHAYDYPGLASRALSTARLYAKIAPSSDHALHMPSHIFTRLGLWQESIQSNLAAGAAAREYALKTKPEAAPAIPLHMLHFLMEGYLQVAQDREAKGILDDLKAMWKVQPKQLNAAVIMAGVPARYAVQRKLWDEAASLQPLQSRFPYAEAITYFARAVGSARSDNVTNARKDVEKLESLHGAAVHAKLGFWAQEIEILRFAAASWLARAEGKNEEALRFIRAATDLEDATEEHLTAREPIVPTREMLGELLIELGQPAQALKEFQTSLNKLPNRFNGLYGAARAAELSGDKQKARDFYSKLVALCEKADTERSELQRAKAFLAKK